jgi:hypothetical protein
MHRFDHHFEPVNPWAQRALLDMCDVPKELKVKWKRSSCWPKKFKEFLMTRQKRFPTRNFYADLGDFAAKESSVEWHVWFKKGTGEMIATFFEFTVNVKNTLPTESALEHKKAWNEYIASRNKMASVTANMAWGTSSLWVRAEADEAIKGSTGVTIIISVLSGFAGVLLFTMDIRLSVFVVGLVTCIIVGLAFFMVCIMGWKLGPIEVIALVAFVGYAVTYTLHVAHHYCYAKPALPKGARPSKKWFREARVKIAVWKIGGAALGSAATTLGASVFLLFCTMRIFTKLGTVVCAVTILSVIFALLVFPALLMIIGPAGPPPMTVIKAYFHKRRHSWQDLTDEINTAEAPPTAPAIFVQADGGVFPREETDNPENTQIVAAGSGQKEESDIIVGRPVP